jgi:hypothetical protein
MQKLWVKKQKQAERERQSKQRAEKLAKLRDPKERRGFRKIHIGDKVYLWRWQGSQVEIRTPDNKKWLVPIWEIQGEYKSEAEWLKDHEECYEECSAYWVQPSLVRSYIDKREAK